MRIATYNIWNDHSNWGQRLYALADELSLLDADVVALQEAPVQASDEQRLDDFLRRETAYPYVLHLPYPEEPTADDRPEGLAFLSKLPIEDARAYWQDIASTANNWAGRITVRWPEHSLSITNVHLDWQHEAGRQQHIVSIIRDLVDCQRCDYDILCGDFNCDLDSLVAHFLAGNASIDGYSTRWRDMAGDYYTSVGEVPPVTLDFLTNPRWQTENSPDTPIRSDRIYLRRAESKAEPRVKRCGLIGKEPVNRHGIVPSDHYGVFVDLEIK